MDVNSSGCWTVLGGQASAELNVEIKTLNMSERRREIGNHTVLQRLTCGLNRSTGWKGSRQVTRVDGGQISYMDQCRCRRVCVFHQSQYITAVAHWCLVATISREHNTVYDCHLMSLIDEWLPTPTISRFHPRILLYLHTALQPIVSYNQTLTTRIGDTLTF